MSLQAKKYKQPYLKNNTQLTSEHLKLPRLYSKSLRIPSTLYMPEDYRRIEKLIQQKIQICQMKTIAVNEWSVKKIGQEAKPVQCSTTLYTKVFQRIGQIFRNLQYRENCLMVLLTKYTNCLNVFFSNMKGVPLSRCCKSRVCIKIKRERLSISCENCEDSMLIILFNNGLVEEDNKYSSQQIDRVSKIVDSGAYRKSSIIQRLKTIEHERKIKKSKQDLREYGNRHKTQL